MVTSVKELIKKNEVKFVDLRFTDTRGKEQHVSVPVSAFDDDKFQSGHAFDGSSIAGWKGIEASDMLLVPDPNTAFVDPFYEESTLVLTCDVIEPSDGKGYGRDSRSLAKRAEAYLKSTGLGDTAFFGPEPEFFIFDSVQWSTDMSGCIVKTVCAGLDQALEALDKDREFLTRGGVFTDGMLDAYLELKGAELQRVRMTTHPVEFELYYSL
ncbi:glutamine synthetase beta-grasp domain-containing protein [Paraburkholderia rhizosphaerae]|uniref:Glutamine synthetase-like protein n=1 Tax=Paraburkholderia rhizosphaerae TaxID=480658 RepID=A0A4V3HEY5_9BURK|nr:glutamine synthetase beta-grasp domain-containing protein [Paraburkholderia rhizosphaerae]TDY50791.1 glutamine synthetase-like protein [Paraburkholderia rhizosphaerae]